MCVWPSVDGPGDIRAPVSSTDTLTGGRQCVGMAILGWTRDVRVTVSSTDTLTGGRQCVCITILGWTGDVRVLCHPCIL